jgi:CRISPR-associated exonuclease Cas4
MMSDILFLIPILVIAIALILLAFMRRKRETLRMPPGTPIYQDRQEERGTILYAHQYRLKGRPDFLFQDNNEVIPVEVKTGSTPGYPHHGHIMQLIAYCVLVESAYGVRPAYGVIRYPHQQFEIAFTPEYEAELEGILDDIREKQKQSDVHRSHNIGKRCASCGFTEQCRERLDLQMVLPLDF